MHEPFVLIVAMDCPARYALAHGVRQAGCRVSTADTAAEDFSLAGSLVPDLVVLAPEVRRQEGSAPQAANTPDAQSAQRPVVVLLPEGWQSVASEPLRLGRRERASFDLAQFAQAVHLLALAAGNDDEEESFIFTQGLLLDHRSYRAVVDGRELKLTLTEFKILWTLAARPDIVLTRQDLTEAGRGGDANVHERTIDVHIRSLRRKLGQRCELIETVRGVGYRFSAPVSTANLLPAALH